MDHEIFEKYMRAGKIAAEARDFGVNLIKSGVKFLDVAEAVESKIKKAGGGLSFPVNISINDVAAHYSPVVDDKRVFHSGDVVKLDVGSHVDGYIADTAVTVEIGSDENSEMINASKEALQNAIDFIKPGVHLSEVGKKIEDTIKGYGFKPIDNLTGHSLQCYNLHSGVSIPNISTGVGKIKKDYALAIEPFATNGKGHVISGDSSNIYICKQNFRFRMIRDKKTRFIFRKIKQKFNTLPFAQRWVSKIFPNHYDMVIKKLRFHGMISQYPQLIEKNHGIVTQKEHTIIVKDGGCEVTTQI